MKKIFAIALAAVMVLSMASAFALSDCFAGFAWPCDAKVNYCGRGTVEVVPAVLVNNACGGSEFQLNKCAGVVAGLPVFYAVKLTVDANPDALCNYPDDQEAAWWDEAALAITAKVADLGNNTVAYNFAPSNEETDDSGIDWDADEVESYYLVANEGALVDDEEVGAWVNVDDLDDYENGLELVVFEATTLSTDDASKVKVCANIESEHDGYTVDGVWNYGDYKVTVTEGKLTVTDGDNTVEYTITDDDETVKVTGDTDFQAEVNKVFNLAGCTLGTCLTDKNVKANFGWDTDGKLENCFSWSSQVSAIVDAECVVAIPKTGDASLLAWLF